jgi:hypothetical protein
MEATDGPIGWHGGTQLFSAGLAAEEVDEQVCDALGRVVMHPV